MNKKQVSSVILSTIILSLLINIFFGRYLTAEISTIPLLNRWKILSPQAPIVINTREEVRVNDTTDLLKVISLARPKLSGIVTVTGGQMSLVGSAENLTSDGLFLSSKQALGTVKPENLYVKLDDGSMAQVSAVFDDPATSLVILKAALKNTPVANISPSQGLSAGDRIAFLAPTLKNYTPFFQASYVGTSQVSDYNTIFDSDKPQQTFDAQGTGTLLPGQAIINMNGDVVGIWDGSAIVSGDTVRDFVNGFFSSGNKVARPSFGFLYRNISDAEVELLNTAQGARVTKVDSASAAQKAGLLENDIVTAVNDTKLTTDIPLNNYLGKFRPGDKVKFTVMRGKNQTNINLTAGELK